MDLGQLKTRLDRLAETLRAEDRQTLHARLQGLASVFPFNEYEYMLMFLCDRRIVSFADYERLRSEYVSSNQYLELYGLAPRIFGEIWAQQHLRDLDARFLKPGTNLDPNYSGEYDLWIDGLKVEVKACRAINTKVRGDLVSKALHYEAKEPFWMNYQQIKVDACDVFVFIGVWVDQIVYWVLSKAQVAKNKYLSHQHRGGIEYQIGITDSNIKDFDEYRANPLDVADRVISLGRRPRNRSNA
jgi:hypothetical protein